MQNPTRDELRERIQNDIRQSIRDAVGGQGGGGGAGPATAEALAVLQAQIEGVRQEITTLTAQLTPGQSRARELAIEGQLERATDRLETLEDQLSAAATGQAIAISRPPPPPPQGVIPQDVKEMALWGMGTLAVTIISIAFIRMWSRWLEQRGHAPSAGSDVTPRLDRIEQAIEAVAIEVERISEGQRYTSKMLHDARALPAPPMPDRWPAAEREPVPARRSGEE